MRRDRCQFGPGPRQGEFARPALPLLFDLGPEGGRQVVDHVQRPSTPRPAIPTSPCPVGRRDHAGKDRASAAGSGAAVEPSSICTAPEWVFGSNTHDRLIRELAVGAGAAVVFPSYSLAEARYPTETAIEECYAVAAWVAEQGATDLDPARIAVAGDSVGGNMSIALTLLAKERGGVGFVTRRCSTRSPMLALRPGSYEEFATGYFLRRDAARGTGTSTPPTRRPARRSPRRRCVLRLSNSRGCIKALLITGKPTCCATRARRTRTSCARPASR